jgi:hypothetical protein
MMFHLWMHAVWADDGLYAAGCDGVVGLRCEWDESTEEDLFRGAGVTWTEWLCSLYL